MADETKRQLIDAEWIGYREAVIPAGASSTQVEASKRAFFAGAMSLCGIIANALSPDMESTEEDIATITAIHNELQAFSEIVIAQSVGAMIRASSGEAPNA